MAKNLFKSLFNSNKDKNALLKNTKLIPTNKLSETVSIPNISEDSSMLQPQHEPMDLYNILFNYYSKKDEQNNIINHFMEKIGKLNNKFHSLTEKFVTTKESYGKLSDELFLNLFKQIDCYVEEIQRLNKKISSIDNKDSKLIIKNLTKELNENKEKIRNIEIKLKEKTTKEEKLMKEIESYKRRIIFFKNKININLMARNNIRGRNRNLINKNNDSSINTSKRNILKINKDERMPKYSSFNKKRSSHNKSQSNSNFSLRLHANEENKGKINVDNINRVPSNNISNFKRVMLKSDNPNEEKAEDNKDKLADNISEGEAGDNNDKVLKVNRSFKPKESIILPFNKNYNQDDDEGDNVELIYVDKNEDDNNNNENLKTEEDLLIHLNEFDSPERKKEDIKLYETVNTEPNYTSENNNTIISKFGDKVGEKTSSISPTPSIKNKRKAGKKNMSILIGNSNNISAKNIKELKTNTTTKKTTGTKKIFSRLSKNLTSTPNSITSKYNSTINDNKSKNNQSKFNLTKSNNKANDDVSNLYYVTNTEEIKDKSDKINSTLEDIKNVKIENPEEDNNGEIKKTRSKTVKFKKEDTQEKEQVYQFTSSESEFYDISSKELTDYLKKSGKTSGDISCCLNKSSTNDDNLSFDGNNKKKVKNKKNEKDIKKVKKNLIGSKSFKSINTKSNVNNYNKKGNVYKDLKSEQNQKKKDKEIGKIFKEMNEDYNNDIEMLKRQEEQIKLMLNLINLNDDES